MRDSFVARLERKYEKAVRKGTYWPEVVVAEIVVVVVVVLVVVVMVVVEIVLVLREFVVIVVVVLAIAVSLPPFWPSRQLAPCSQRVRTERR